MDEPKRVWLEIGDLLINADQIAFVQRMKLPTPQGMSASAPQTKGCMFIMINGAQLEAPETNFEQIKTVLGFQVNNAKKPDEN